MALDTIFIGIVSICHRDALLLFDPYFTYLYVSSYFSSHLGMTLDSLDIFVYVSILVGDSILVDWVYRFGVVTINECNTMVDILLLDMVYFEMILGMYCLFLYHAILDCHA